MGNGDISLQSKLNQGTIISFSIFTDITSPLNYDNIQRPSLIYLSENMSEYRRDSVSPI